MDVLRELANCCYHFMVVLHKFPLARSSCLCMPVLLLLKRARSVRSVYIHTAYRWGIIHAMTNVYRGMLFSSSSCNLLILFIRVHSSPHPAISVHSSGACLQQLWAFIRVEQVMLSFVRPLSPALHPHKSST